MYCLTALMMEAVHTSVTSPYCYDTHGAISQKAVISSPEFS
jgi:hypothetical protein